MSLNSIAGYRLSPQQAYLWELQQQHPTLPQQAWVTVACEGRVEISALIQAIKQVVQRHEILRTTFQQLPEMTLPLQVIDEEGSVDINFGKPATHPRQQRTLQATLEVLSTEKTLLHLTLPTLCADATTLKLLSQAIAQEYGVVLGQASEDDPMQYADLAAWQNDLLESEDTREGRDYWQKSDRTEAALRLPFEFNLSETPPFQPACLNHSLTDSQSEQLTALSRAQQISLSSILLALWKIVLFRLAQPQRLTIGVTTNGRHYAELENALGLLAKSLPLTTNWTPELTCCEFFEEIERSRLDASQWQAYFSGTPTPIPVGFELVTGFSELTHAGVTFSVQQRHLCLEPFPLKLTVIQQGSLELEFHYSANRFEPAAIAQIARTFQTALDAVLAAPTAPIGQLNLVNHQERQRLLAPPSTPPPLDVCLHQWVEAQAQQHPNARAVVFEEHSLTYAELNARANQLAHVLQQGGVRPETPVALYIERSAAAIVGLLGILKAGGAYVPIDPDLPLSGVQFRLQDTGATVIVTQFSLARSLSGPALASAQVLCLDADWSKICHAPETTPNSTVNADNLAYILFTSGSTGTPKGVAIAHRQLTSYVHSILPQLALGNDTKANFALISTLAADVGHTILFASLCSGGCLHVISRDRALDSEALADYCQAHPIDYLKIVPSHLKGLLSGSRPQAILPKHLILGGEVSYWDDLARLQQLQPHCAILNHYGPTETTVGVLTYAVRGREAALDSQTAPLGFPLANARVYLLDEALQPVPIGAAGEIYIGGAGVGRGYWQRPGLTAEVFLPDPFSEEAGARFYQTGDRARFRLDGTLEFLGRSDSQVKIRGHRVELGEIEATLQQHPHLQTAVVLCRSEGQLAAYALTHRSPPPSVSDIRQFLQERLPEAAIPPAIAILDTLPLLPNGKIDRQALLKRELVPPSSRQFVAPRSSVEVAIAQLWSQVLGVERVGLHDSFFELGGDSILCIQVVARATQAGLRFTPKQLFEHPTIAELAPLVDTTQTPSAAQTPVVGSVPLTPIQQWFFEQAGEDAHHWNQSVLLQSQHPLDPALLKQAVHHLIEHHDALRLQFKQELTGWQQWNALVPADTPFFYIDLSALPQSAQLPALEATAAALQASLDLENLLLRIVLFKLDGSWRLLILAHHLVIDGVSWRILLADLQQIYQQLQQGQAVQLPPKTTAFKTWAEQLPVWANSKHLQEQLDYWRTVATFPTISLPVESDVKNRVADARSLSISLSPQETAALLQEVPAAYQTQIDEILLTALAMAVLDPEYSPIACQSNSEAVLRVDLEGHGRETLFEDLDLSRTVGWFTTLFPVALRLSPSDHLGNTIKSIKEQLRCVPQQGIGYGVLRYLTEYQLRASTAQIRFNYLGQIDATFAEPAWLSPAAESPGLGRSPRSLRPYLLDINGWVSKSQLTWRWDYGAALHPETVAQLADGYGRALRSLVQHCQSPEAGGYTPSDFPDAALDQTDLDKLLGQLG
ncbi:MAG: amino acid adenylation domain-containing protein [Cyanophyceae cyanobacterium]